MIRGPSRRSHGTILRRKGRSLESPQNATRRLPSRRAKATPRHSGLSRGTNRKSRVTIRRRRAIRHPKKASRRKPSLASKRRLRRKKGIAEETLSVFSKHEKHEESRINSALLVLFVAYFSVSSAETPLGRSMRDFRRRRTEDS